MICASAAPTVSSSTSCADATRDGTNDWCHSSIPATAAAIATAPRAQRSDHPVRSPRHAEIVHDDDDGWLLRDCGSVNGTLLNGLRVVDPQPLRPGDRIGLGDSEVVFNAAADDTTSHIVAVESSSHATNMTIAV